MVIKNWKKLNSKIVYKGYRTVIRETFLLQDGRKDDFDNISGADGALVIVRNAKNEILLVKQYRPGPERITYGFPAGIIDKNMSPLATAKKELIEETGYEAKNFKLLNKSPRDAYSKNFHYLFTCDSPKYVGEIENDANEWIEAKFYSPTQIDKIVKSGQAGNTLSNFWIGYRMKK